MPTKPLNLGVRSNPGRYPAAGACRLINAYAEDAGSEGVMQWPIWCADGLELFSNLLGSSGVRAMLELDGYLYVVAGRVIYRVDQTGAATIIGGMASDGHVGIARNRKATPQIGISCDGLTMIVENGTVTQVTDADLLPAIDVCHIDGYFIYLAANGRLTSSNIDEGSAIEAADYAEAEGNPDGGSRVIANGRDLLAFGPKSCEFWQNVGNADFPFSRSAVIERGLLAPGGVTLAGDAVVFIDQDRIVRALDGYTPRRISTHAMERIIADEPTQSGITATSWTREGHTFACFSGSSFSICYDLTTGLWHERKSYGLDRWRVSCVTEFAGNLIAGDYNAPNIYTMSPDVHDENGDELVWSIQTPPVHAYPSRVRVNRLDVNMVPGVGINTTAEHNRDPQVMLAWADDGTNFGNERMASAGVLGDSQATVEFRRLGTTQPHGRTYRLSMSADVVKGVMGASIDYEPVR